MNLLEEYRTNILHMAQATCSCEIRHGNNELEYDYHYAHLHVWSGIDEVSNAMVEWRWLCYHHSYITHNLYIRCTDCIYLVLRCSLCLPCCARYAYWGRWSSSTVLWNGRSRLLLWRRTRLRNSIRFAWRWTGEILLRSGTSHRILVDNTRFR